MYIITAASTVASEGPDRGVLYGGVEAVVLKGESPVDRVSLPSPVLVFLGATFGLHCGITALKSQSYQ